MMDCLISVIIPTYNHERYIKKAVTSVLSQKCDYEFEIIIADDCSTDSTQQVLKSIEPML